MIDSKNASIDIIDSNFEVNFDIDKIDSPALQRILHEFSDPDIVSKMYDKHSDWGQQGQCGCVVGCLGG
jgi:hypothetical protein